MQLRGNRDMIQRRRRHILTVISFLIVLGVLTAVGASGQTSGDMFGASDQSEPRGEKSLVAVSTVFSYTSAQPGKTYWAAVIAAVKPGWHINSANPSQDWLIPAALEFDTVPGLMPRDIVYPPAKDIMLIGETMSVYDGRVLIFFQITIDQDATLGEIFLPIRLTYQLCNDKECRPPETAEVALSVNVGDEGLPVEGGIFAAAGPTRAADVSDAHSDVGESDLQRLIDKYGFWGYFLALGVAFITGLLLSFSPCTYPMIPITVSIFAGQQRTLGRGFVLSLFYVGSMAVVYGIMGLIVSLVGGVFGAWLASPPVVIAIAVIFCVFALSMFGLYELNVPSGLRQKLGTTKTGGGVIGSIILGVVAALVVSPCVGPFVAGILLYIAAHGSPVVGFLVLFVFALGLGTLFVIIGTFSSAVAALPRAGQWMDAVKKFFGFVLLLMALYFLKTIISPTMAAVLTGIVLLAMGVFGGGLDRLTPETGFFVRLKKFVGIVALLLGIYFLMGAVITGGLILPPLSQWPAVSQGGSRVEHESGIPWETDMEAALARARSEGKPVMIDTWATWCVNCRVLEKKTFSHPEIIAEARRFVPLKIQLEKADSPMTKEFMARFGWKMYSLPTTVLISSSGETEATLKGVVTPQELLARMRATR